MNKKEYKKINLVVCICISMVVFFGGYVVGYKINNITNNYDSEHSHMDLLLMADENGQITGCNEGCEKVIDYAYMDVTGQQERNISDSTYVQNQSFTGENNHLVGISFNGTGTILYLLSYSDDAVYQYACSTPWNITTCTYDSESLVWLPNNAFSGIFFKPDGSRLYNVDWVTDVIAQYSCGSNWDLC